MNQIKPPMLYKVQVIKNDYPKQLFDLDLMVQVNLPDGRVLQSRLAENLRQWVGHTEMIDMISASMSCRLLEGLQKNLQTQISEMIWEILKEERKYPIWNNDLIRCPSQCYCYFETDGKKYCIYLRWRWDDPWTASIVPVDNRCDFTYDDNWEYIDTKFYSHDDYEKLQEKCIKIIKKKFNDVKWLVKEYYGYGN